MIALPAEQVEAGAWIERESGYPCHVPYSMLAYRRDGRILAAIRFQNWCGADVELTVAGKVIPRSLLRDAWRYVVNQLGCRRATFRTRSDNLAAIRAMGRLGAQMEGVQRAWYPDGCDSILFGILKEEYPYHG